MRLAGSLAVWAATLIAASNILDRDSAGVALRAAAVALAIGGFLPWVWMA